MEELKWNLNELFQSNEEFYKKVEEIDPSLSKIKENYSKRDIDESSLYALLEAEWKLRKIANDILIYGSLMYYKDVDDEETGELKRIAEETNSKVIAELHFIDAKIVELGPEKIEIFLTQNPALETYRHHLEELFRKEDHIQDDETTAKIKENSDFINRLLKDYNALLRDVKYGSIEIDGELIELTSSNFAKYISSRNRETRRQTYFAVNEAFVSIAKEFASILNSLYSTRIQNASLERYNSVLEKSLFEENIDPQVLETLITAVTDNIPLMRRYLKIKSKLLNIDDPHLYDFTVPIDFDANRKFPLDEAINIIKGALEPLGKDYLHEIEKLLNGHIDASLDEKKHQSITFSWGSYSFLNYKDSYGDLKNLIHELGHIVNYRLSEKEQPFIYADSTVFVGETASIVNEILLTRYLYKTAETDEERAYYLSKEIENFFTSVFKQTMYTEFEDKLYSLKLSDPLDDALLKEEYARVIKNIMAKISFMMK